MAGTWCLEVGIVWRNIFITGRDLWSSLWYVLNCRVVHKFLPSALLQRTFTLHKNEADRQRVTEAVVMNISMTAAASNHWRLGWAILCLMEQQIHLTDFMYAPHVRTENYVFEYLKNCSIGKDYDLCWACNHYRQHRSYIPGSAALLQATGVSFVQAARTSLHALLLLMVKQICE